MTRDQWAARVADAVMEIARDAAADAIDRELRYGSGERDRKKLRQELIYLLSELPE